MDSASPAQHPNPEKASPAAQAAPGALAAQATDANEPIDALLAHISQSHLLTPALASENVEGWTALGRPALLEHLKGLGVRNLKERQALVNGLLKYRRQCMLQPTLRILASSTRAPVMTRATYGLCNQLRVLLSYRAIAVTKGRLLVLHWQRTAACNGRFSDLFVPVDGAIVVDEPSQLELICPGLSKLPSNAIPSTCFIHPGVFATPLETAMWKVLQPQPALRDAIDSKLRELGPSFVAVHIRRTDHLTQGGQRELMRQSGEWVHDEDFERFLEDRHPDAAIYLATDNQATQERFGAKYGGRIKALTPICPPPREYVDETCVHRHTSINDAVVDIFVCAASQAFKGTYYSSFSDAIQRLRLAHGHANEADDEHELGPPGWDPVRSGSSQDDSVSLDDPSVVALLNQMSVVHPNDFGAAHAAWLGAGWGVIGEQDGGRWLPTGALTAAPVGFPGNENADAG